MPGSGTLKINVPPPTRNLTSAPGAATFLADAKTWNDDVVRRLAVEQLNAFMGPLPQNEWRAYLKLRTGIRTSADAISQDFQARVKTWEDDCVAAINTAINVAIGPQVDGPLDCRTAWLNTDYHEVHSRLPRALAEGELVPKRHSVTLWDAARQGFSYAVAWDFGAGRDFVTASFISRVRGGGAAVWSADVSQFAGIVRRVDPGARAARLGDDLLEAGSGAALRRNDLHIDTMAFDIMDAARSPATTGVDASVRDRLHKATVVAPESSNWRRYRAEFGITVPALGVGHWVQLPYFTYAIEDVGVVAHAIGYPAYPLRVFSHQAQAEAWLNSTVDLAAPWLQAQLSADDRERAVELRKSLAQTDAPLPGLNQVAELLRDVVSAVLPKPAITLVIDSWRPQSLSRPYASAVAPPWALASPGRDFARSRIRANAARLATPKGQLDWTYARQAGLEMASEILDLLITPVPGRLHGLNRLRTAAFGGFIGVGVAQGVFDGSRGSGARLAGAAVDILDLAFGLYSGRMAAQAELRQAGYRRVALDGATDGFWRFDADAMVRPVASMVDGQQPSNDGVIHVLGKSFVRLDEPPGTTTVLAAGRGDDGRWRLRPGDTGDYAPAIKRSGDYWVLDLDDTPGLDDTTLLSRSLSMAGLPATRDAATRLQDMTGITRAELDRIWGGEAPPSWFNAAATRIAIGDILNRLLSTYPRHEEPVHGIGEALYAQFLADTLGKRVHVVDDNGITAYLLSPRSGLVTRGDEFTLHRQPGGFYGARRDAPRGSRIGIPGILDVALAEEPFLGASHVSAAGTPPLQARRQIVNAASDNWVRRHVREIRRACLHAFDLETPRQPNDFLTAGRVAAGSPASASDTRAEATMAQLQYRYPGMTRADAMAVLADQTLGPLARGEPDADDLTSAMGDLGVFSRVVAARFRALYGQYDADSEALLLTGLTSHPVWPAHLSIEVFQGGVDPQTGDIVSHGLSVARFGTGSTPLMLVRTPEGSHRLAWMQGTTMVVAQKHGPHAVPLVRKVIEALPEDHRHRFRVLTFDASSIVDSLDMPATSKILVDAAAQGIRASTPLEGSYAAPIRPEDFPNGAVNGYYSAFIGGAPRSFVQVDGVMARAIPDGDDPARARLLSHLEENRPGLEYAPVVRLDHQGHWRLVRVTDRAQGELTQWESPGGGFSQPSTLLMPLDGIETIVVAGSTWHLLVGRERVRVAFDVDFQAWRSIAQPGRVFRRAEHRWREGAVTSALDAPTHFESVQIPSIPVPPIDAKPLPKTIGFGWTGLTPPSAAWLATLVDNARVVNDGKGGWSTQLHVDLGDASQVRALKATLEPQHVQVNDLRRDRAFLDWLRTPAGELYTAARDGLHPCNAAAMDMLRFAWILKRHGGLYVDMDDVILKDWTKVEELQAAPFQLVSGGPVNHALLGLDWDVNTSNLGSHAGNPLLDRIVESMIERAAIKPDFFNEPPQADAQSYGRELSELTGPAMLRDVLKKHAPEIPDLIAAMRVLRENDIRYEALELAVADAIEAYFPLAARIDPGSRNSWVPSND
ncbi:glycosyltransferase [Pinirhizobacter sp.]|uniref:glycosyltransferase n=1 Tax=Pinirhizobacter sp. TaxID=2950432 RepID=UPI002F3FFBE6